jgi:hypothetical protein
MNRLFGISLVPRKCGKGAFVTVIQPINVPHPVKISAATLHQFWSPAEGGYRESRSIPIGERIESVAIPGLAVESSGFV